MKKVFMILLCSTVMFVLINCSSPRYIVSEKGDKANVELIDGRCFSSEIVLISDTAIFFLELPEDTANFPVLFYVNNKDLKSISIKGYNGSGWVAPVLTLQVLPAVLMAIAASSVKDNNYGGFNSVGIGVLFAIPAAVTALIFASTEGDTPHWDDSMPLDEIKNLKIYSRYPKGLSMKQMELLIQMNNQKHIYKY